jgi:glutamyl/glutaminyl-tRNA synthetase
MGHQLIKKGVAYVDDLTAEQIREHRGTLTQPGKDSPYRDRPVEENLDLFERMRSGEFPEGSPRAPRQNGYGSPQHQHARPHPLPHPPRRTPRTGG